MQTSHNMSKRKQQRRPPNPDPPFPTALTSFSGYSVQVKSLDWLGRRRDMTDNSAEILFRWGYCEQFWHGQECPLCDVLYYIKLCSLSLSLSLSLPAVGAADAEIKIPSFENTVLKGSSFKAWGRSAYSHNATLTARDFFHANFYPSGPFMCIFFPETSPEFFLY